MIFLWPFFWQLDTQAGAAMAQRILIWPEAVIPTAPLIRIFLANEVENKLSIFILIVLALDIS